jgi:hypothetical protein
MGDPCGLGRKLDEKIDITPPDPDEHDPAFADGHPIGSGPWDVYPGDRKAETICVKGTGWGILHRR